jgi:CBS domain-containing protein
MMTQIKDIMTEECKWVAPSITLKEIAEQMRDKDFGFIPVGENDKLVGMITDRDIVIRAVAEGKDPSQCTAGDIMTGKTYYCYDDQDIETVCDNMGELQIRRLPVVNRDKSLVGVVSMGDLAQSATRQNIGQAEQEITNGVSNDRIAA